jgi:hypothetical protein
MDVALPLTQMQQHNCHTTMSSRIGGNRSTISLSGTKVMRQAMIISMTRKVAE